MKSWFIGVGFIAAALALSMVGTKAEQRTQQYQCFATPCASVAQCSLGCNQCLNGVCRP